jgi:hypothetical protein
MDHMMGYQDGSNTLHLVNHKMGYQVGAKTIDNKRDSLNSSRSTTLASFHQSSSESIFYPPMSSSSVASSVSKFVVEGGRLVRRSQDISSLMAGSPPSTVAQQTFLGNESR